MHKQLVNAKVKIEIIEIINKLDLYTFTENLKLQVYIKYQNNIILKIIIIFYCATMISKK